MLINLNLIKIIIDQENHEVNLRKKNGEMGGIMT